MRLLKANHILTAEERHEDRVDKAAETPVYRWIRPIVVHPTKRADVSRHGYRAAQFEDAIARFLPPEPNIRTLKRGGGEKT
jgi:hypothetical protein